ncbi:MAG: AlpA family phage regulatory protein [Terracidiphilus sp.]|jgi:prophage regulatory protein
MRKMLKLRNVLDKIPYSKAKLYELIAKGKFPEQLHLGGSGSFWLEEEVEEWLEGHIAAERAVRVKKAA